MIKFDLSKLIFAFIFFGLAVYGAYSVTVTYLVPWCLTLLKWIDKPESGWFWKIILVSFLVVLFLNLVKSIFQVRRG